MSFLPAVQRQINQRRPDDPVRVTLEFLMQNAVGRTNAVPLDAIIKHLKQRKIQMSETDFQQGILAKSRSADYFIGSGRRGYFLIDDIRDAEEMRDFYTDRITAETQNLGKLRREAQKAGWTI
jgi:hypothetical protein